MTNLNLKTIQKCLDDYMLRKGKTEIGDIEANQVLAVAGVINDDQAHPGNTQKIARHQSVASKRKAVSGLMDHKALQNNGKSAADNAVLIESSYITVKQQ